MTRLIPKTYKICKKCNRIFKKQIFHKKGLCILCVLNKVVYVEKRKGKYYKLVKINKFEEISL